MKIRGLLFFAVLTTQATAWCAQTVQCFDTHADLQADKTISNVELLGRLVLAEGFSSRVKEEVQCRTVWREVFTAIAWGVRGRVALGGYGKGIRGVIFQRGQFNPAVSPHSRYAPLFLCPSQSPAAADWEEILDIAGNVLRAPAASNPFLHDVGATSVERRTEIAHVNQFYYPLSFQATKVPPAWARGTERRVTNLKVGSKSIPDACIWFFRNGTGVAKQSSR